MDEDADSHHHEDDISEIIKQLKLRKPEKQLSAWQRGVYEELFNHFPYEKYDMRDAQKEVFEKLVKALYEGKKIILIQAPTGVGKSAISYTVLKFSEYGYVCSSTKALQEQMLYDFLDLVTAKGRSNFTCLMRKPDKDGKFYDCEHGACNVLKFDCDRKPSFKESPWIAYFSVRDKKTKYWQVDLKKNKVCPYWEAKAAALNNFAVVHNYSYILAEANHIGEFTKRDVLISDEAHNVEAKILDFIKISITQEHLDVFNMFLDDSQKIHFVSTNKDMANFDKMRLHAAWVMDLSRKTPTVMGKIEAESKKATDEKYAILEKIEYCKQHGCLEDEKIDLAVRLEAKEMRLDDLFNLQDKIEKLMKNQIAFFLRDIAINLDNWVVKEEEDGFAIGRIEFQPICIDKYANDLYFRLGDINILQSATILDKVRFCMRLGLDPDPKVTEYIKIEPSFPIENHKIFNLSWADFGHCKTETEAELEEFFKQVVERVDIIIDLFPEERGIIHATSYPIAEYFMKYSKHANGRLTFHGKDDRNEKLELHKSKNGSVLVSPSMTEGVDLKDDYSRFQILIKVPYPDAGDERIKARIAMDQPGYYYETAITVIQSIGRSVRSEKDHAITFCLDDRMPGFTYHSSDIMDLYTRYVLPNTKLKYIDILKGKPEIVKILTDKVSRPKKEVEKAEKRKQKRAAKPAA